MPAVVPQLKSITIGGAIAGIGIESSSFKYGFVHETMQELDVLASRRKRSWWPHRENEHRDLFFGFPNSYGTLGYALRVKIALVPVKPFVKLAHHRYSDSGSLFSGDGTIVQRAGVDFVDGTMFHDQELYITTGEFVDQAEWLSDYTYLQIYYQSIRNKNTDYLTTHDYIWRWDTDWFWCSKHFLLQYPMMRRLWGKERLRSAVYWKLWKRFNASPRGTIDCRAIGGRQEAVIQDVEMPIEQAPRLRSFFNEEIGIKPVWICPVAAYDPSASYALYPMNPRKALCQFWILGLGEDHA